MSNMFLEEGMKIQDNNVSSIINEKNVDFNTSSPDHGLLNIKCEFDEEETKIQFGVLENQLLEENVNNKFSLSITKLHDDEDGEISGSFQKNQPIISDKVSQEGVKIEPSECKSDITEESNTSLDYELSNIKCEFEEEETKIQYGILDDQLHHENITKYSTDITTVQILNGASSQNNESTIFELGFKRHNKMMTEEKWSTQNNSHTGENPFKCEPCGQSFSRKMDLDTHLKIHTGEKPNKCEICGKCLSTKQNFLKHMRIHTGEKPHKCETCGKCFRDKQNCLNHMRIHTGEKPYKCDTCSKCFGRKGHLNQHMTIKKHIMIHTEEKPYKCEICGKYFKLKHHLNRHMMVHTGEKPHKCEICDKCFSAKQNLDIHMRIHTGEKPYTCERCSRCFRAPASIRIHTCEKSSKFND